MICKYSQKYDIISLRKKLCFKINTDYYKFVLQFGGKKTEKGLTKAVVLKVARSDRGHIV